MPNLVGEHALPIVRAEISNRQNRRPSVQTKTVGLRCRQLTTGPQVLITGKNSVSSQLCIVAITNDSTRENLPPFKGVLQRRC